MGGTINIALFEAEGGSDKGFDGHRKDTMPIVNEINKIRDYTAMCFSIEILGLLSSTITLRTSIKGTSRELTRVRFPVVKDNSSHSFENFRYTGL